jgi:hypothetical protein
MRHNMRARTVRLAAMAASAAALAAISLGTPGAAAQPAQGPPQALLFTNPVLGPGQDPSVMMAGGWYYFTQTSPDATYITIRRARSIKSLAAAPKTVVWRGGGAGSPCCEWWAPELHFIDGAWYIYTTADNGNNDNHLQGPAHHAWQPLVDRRVTAAAARRGTLPDLVRVAR